VKSVKMLNLDSTDGSILPSCSFSVNLFIVWNEINDLVLVVHVEVKYKPPPNGEKMNPVER